VSLPLSRRWEAKSDLVQRITLQRVDFEPCDHLRNYTLIAILRSHLLEHCLCNDALFNFPPKSLILLARPERDGAKSQKTLYLLRNFRSCRAR
jgi:hypothetical protein